MSKRQIVSEDLSQPSGHFSHATTIAAQGTMVFISGMTARRADGTIAGIGDVTEQTKQVCENLKAAMAAAGGTLDDICRVDVYIRNMEHFPLIHEVRRQYFSPPLPASTMVEVTKMTSPSSSSRSAPSPCWTRWRTRREREGGALMNDFPHVFAPLTLRHRTLRCRINLGAHTTNMSEGGLPSDRHIAYYRERALGGAGMIVVEPVPVQPRPF